MTQKPSSIRRAHIIFKTHLDVGFTQLARVVLDAYFTDHLPRAMALAKQLREEGAPGRFRWTTGSWLIHEYLERAGASERRALEEALQQGDIVWHALPFTTHTELMTVALFRYGLSLSQDLDRRFGRKTIAAKMTDVPGHTRAVVPLLAEAGVKFLHIGVNPASHPPAVPDQFVWRHTDGSEVVVMYDKGDYGGTHVLPGFDDALVLAHRGDNQGPPTRDEVLQVYADTRARFPDAELIASTLDDFAAALWKQKATLPVVTQEIGDTWIHGVGTDPHKVSVFREQCRHGNANGQLLLVAEHTWGRDLKQWRETDGQAGFWTDPTFETRAFQEKRRQGAFAIWEESWQEQRDYLGVKATSLPPPAPAAVTAERTFTTHDFEIALDPSGRLLINGQPACILQYQVFGSEDYQRFFTQYNPNPEKTAFWAVPDFTKPGLEAVLRRGKQWTPSVRSLSRVDDSTALHLVLALGFPPEPVETYGCPAEFWLRIAVSKIVPEIQMELTWHRKQACRIPEALWFGFQPAGLDPQKFALTKLGQPISPFDVVEFGARSLHAVEDVHTDQWRLRSLDAPLVAVGRPKLLDFDNRLPDPADGFHFNLHNNIFGSNFPLWYDEDARFRFDWEFRQ